MKKAIVLLVLMITVQTAFSQMKPFRFGLKVAPNIGWISPGSEDYENEGSVAGFTWGFISDFTITENYFVSTGFNISYLNGKLSFPHEMEIIDNADTNTFTGNLNRKYNLRYIELPATLKMKTGKFDDIQVYGQVGFSLGFNVSANSKDKFGYEFNDVYFSESDERDIAEEIKFLKGSLILGGGIEYYIDNSTSILAGITYHNGVSNILKGNNARYSDIDQKATANYIELTLGVIF
ncbi:MAG: porin family protein [Bacteroidales bacterium]